MLTLAAAVLLCAVALSSAFTTPLDEYIALPDPTYTYYDTVSELPRGLPAHLTLRAPQGHSFSGPGYDAYILNMTSQTWLPPDQVSRSIWFVAVVWRIVVDDASQPNNSRPGGTTSWSSYPTR